MIYLTKQTQRGFSLVEMLVAVSILLLVIVGPMTVTSRTAKSSSFSAEQIQAFFLAQEGLELAQMARDNLLLEDFIGGGGGSWDDFIDTSGVYADCYNNGCGLEWDGVDVESLKTPVSCAISTDCKLYYAAGAARSRFTYTGVGNETTPFTREINFVRDGDSVKVTSTVTWRTGSLIAQQKVEVETYLFNIYP